MNVLNITRGHLLKFWVLSLAMFVCMGIFSNNVKAEKSSDKAAPVIAFLNIGGGAIIGSSTVEGFENEIEVLELSYGLAQAGEWEEGAEITGRITTFGELSILKFVDIASPHLALASAEKQQFDTAVITIAPNDATWIVTLGEVIVTSVLVDYNSLGGPQEQITLSYRIAAWEYNGQSASYNLGSSSD